jgi:hypothetical protein
MSNTSAENKLALSAGAYYRWNDAIIPTVKIDYKQLGIGFSYDANISKLKPASRSIGSFELTLSYISFYKSKQSSSDKYRCPKGVIQSF